MKIISNTENNFKKLKLRDIYIDLIIILRFPFLFCYLIYFSKLFFISSVEFINIVQSFI